MNTFQKGDIVRCVDADTGPLEPLSQNQLYRVKKVGPTLILVQNDNFKFGRYFKNRFVLVERETQKPLTLEKN